MPFKYRLLSTNDSDENPCHKTSNGNVNCCEKCFLKFIYTCSIWKFIQNKIRLNFPICVNGGQTDELEMLQNSEFEDMFEDLRQSNEDLKAKNESLLDEIKVLRQEKDTLSTRVRDLGVRVVELTEDNNKEKHEKENALIRLSAVAGDRLRLNNPGIADLSDEYRPNKLAEKFSELYDNEWTEYYEDLERTGSKEEEIIWQLLDLIQKIYTVSNEMAKNQREILIKVITHPGGFSSDQTDNPPEGMILKVIDFQKRTAPWAFGDVIKQIMDNYISDNKNEVKMKYIERCVQICWMMAIQDPPMYLDFGPPKNSLVDKNVYKMFTRTGEKVDFLVWPAVFLHKNGPLVQKGVLQPLESSDA